MAIDLQIRADALGNAIANAVQAALFESCFPTVGSSFIDHADVAPPPVAIVAAGGQVHARVPIQIYVVERAKLLTAPNSVPPGATVPAGIVTLVLEIAATGATITARCVDVETGGLGAGLGLPAGSAACGLLGAASAPLSVDLAAMFAALGAGTPATARVELLGPLVAIRFDPVGPAVDRLLPGQSWGLFMDGAAVERLATAQIPAGALQQLRSLVPGAAPVWSPEAGVPRVALTVSGSIEFEFAGIDVLTVDFSGGMEVELQLIPGVTGFLKLILHRSARVDAGALVPRPEERKAERAIKALMDPTKTGKPKSPQDFVKTGEDTFEKLIALPPIALGRARLRYDAMLGMPAGLALGGAVTFGIAPSRETLRANATPFGLPSILFLCRELAKSGSGDPPREVTLDQMWTNGWVTLSDGGAYCGLEILQPSGLDPFVRAPAAGPGADPRSISFSIPSIVAQDITLPVRLIVRASRGVRLIDLGVPPKAETDAQGHVTNGAIRFIDNCLYLTSDSPSRVDWGSPIDQTELVPPLEDPNWTRWLEERGEIQTQLVTLSGLEAGELLEFKSADHQIRVTADGRGRAVVPVVLPARDVFHGQLARVSRRAIGHELDVQAALFSRQGRGDGTALNPQPLPPVDDIALKRRLTGIIPTLAEIIRLPGFEEAPVAVALLRDGAKLVVDLGDEAYPRVSGSFEGPIGTLGPYGDGLSGLRLIRS